MRDDGYVGMTDALNRTVGNGSFAGEFHWNFDTERKPATRFAASVNLIRTEWQGKKYRFPVEK